LRGKAKKKRRVTGEEGGRRMRRYVVKKKARTERDGSKGGRYGDEGELRGKRKGV